MTVPVDGARPVVLVFSNQLLPPSETFVRAQGEALRDFTPFYVGARRAPGLVLPEDRLAVINTGGAAGRTAEIAFKLTGFAPGLVRSLRRLRPVLLHAHFGFGGTLALPLARALGVPLAVSFHGTDVTADDETLRRTGYILGRYVRHRERLAREAGLFVAVSRFLHDRLIARGFPADRVVVHYTGVDTRLFRPGPEPRSPVVLFVGRLVPSKGCAGLIAAMADLQRRHPEAELVILGDGPLRADLEGRARESLRRFRLLGAQPPEVVREWMARAAMLCVPAVAEGFGMVFLEAQASGLPVVGFASGGVPEAVVDGITGLLAPEGDWRRLAAAVDSLLGDEELRRRLGAAGVRHARERFELTERTAMLEDLYRDLLASAGRGR